MILFETVSDSREAWVSGGSGPNVFDGTTRDIRSGAGLTNVPASMFLPWIRQDLEIVADGGCSGTELSIWNSGARPDGKTMTALNGLGAGLTIIQFLTNDVQGNVVDAATRDSVAATRRINVNALIADRVAAGRKVIVATCIQRSDVTGANAYLTNTALKRDSVDIWNGTLLTDVAANYPSGTQVRVADLRALTNLGGALTGAYVDTALFPDGCHGNQLVARRICGVYNTALNALGLTTRGVQPMHRATGAAEQQLKNGTLENIVGTFADAAIIRAKIQCAARTMPAGSSEIGAPAFGNGLRFFPFIYFANGAPFRVIFERPEIRVIT